MTNDTQRPDKVPQLAFALAPILACVFVVFLVTGAALPALPLHIHDDLGFGPFIVGLVAGTQFVASLLSRLTAGSFSDGRGPKHAVVVGMLLAMLAGALYLVSLSLGGRPIASVCVLLVARGVMGAAESFVITGAQSWGLLAAGPDQSAKIIGWMGTALYVGLAAGAPLGSFLFGSFGFAAIGIMTIAMALLSLLMVLPIAGVQHATRANAPFRQVLHAVRPAGVAVAAASLGYGAMAAFSVLLFVERGWEPAWFSFTIFAVAFILTRLTIGGLPDRIGGAKTAIIFAIIQAVGMAMIALSPSALVGFLGAAITGFGYSLVYPGLGREAVNRVPAHARGTAMSFYGAFLDVALGILTPLLGALASFTGLATVFLVGSILALCTVPIAVRLHSKGSIDPA